MHEGCPARLTESIWQEWVECFLVPHFTEVPPQPDDKRAALQVQLDTINENLAALRKAVATASKSVTDEFQKTIEEAVAERTKVEARIAALPPASRAVRRLGGYVDRRKTADTATVGRANRR